MLQRQTAFASSRHLQRRARIAARSVTLTALAALAALAACGGGGSTGGTPTATVSSASVSATHYAAPAFVTINGLGLDSTLGVSSNGCKNFVRLTAAPYVSSTTTAYYQCTVSGALSSTVTIQSNGTTIGSAPFTVPAPQVTMAVNNGLGVNGNLVITLKGDVAPITVDNFLAYVNSGFYNGLIFHRVSPNFVIQGGGYKPSVNGVLPAAQATSAPIAYESGGGKNLQWTISMARTQQLNSATSQFFINLVDNPSLDGSDPYAVFGTISTTSIPVVQAITAAPCAADNTDLPAGDCLPIPNVVITAATQTQ